MKKSIKLVNVLSVSVLTLGLVAPVTTVSADTANSENIAVKTNNESTQSTGTSGLEIYDQYVQVNPEKNQFELSKLGEKVLPTTVSSQIQSQLNATNKEIKANNFIIDPETKAIVKYSPYINFAASVSGAARLRSGCYVRWFWWGFRFYFTSNAAVTWFRGILGGASSGATIGNLVAAATGHAMAATTIEAFGMYADSMSRDLYDYNKKHRRSKVYMDLNGVFQYSFHTF